MATDLFSNDSNDYINPDLAPCAGATDTETFEFLSGKQVGVISGSSVVVAMDLDNISQTTEGWVQKTKLLQSGEVIFVEGLTKGITQRYQRFPFDGSVAYTGTNHNLYMSVDLSINYYKSFRYYQDAVYATADPDDEVDIAAAINLAFAAKGITVDAAYDASALSFTGETAGYSYDVTAVDVSLWEPDTSVWGKTLNEDTSSAIPYAKYPNGGMLGYVLMVTYPTTAEDYESYVKINHPPDYLTYYTAHDVSQFITPALWDTSTYYLPITDTSLFLTPATWESSTYYTADGSTIDVSVFLTYATWEASTYDSSTIDVSVFLTQATWESSTYYSDASATVSVDVSIFTAPETWEASIYYTGTFRKKDVSVYTSPEIWETSTYYVRNYKEVDVGLSGASCTPGIMSAAEYLDWVETNSKWEKVGVYRSWLTAADPDGSNTENLITGFYIYNPQSFSVQIDYMTIL